jgi:ribosome-binding factor A
MPRTTNRAPAQRPLRVGEELRHALARIFARGELRDPDLADATLTITEVRVSPDLKSALAFVMPLAGARTAPTLAALRRSAPFLRRLLAREVRLRHAPEIEFVLDTSFDHATRIDAVMRRPEVERDLGPRDPDEADDDGA